MKIAAIQMVSGAAVQANLDTARHWLLEAARQGCELALLPEHFALLGQHDTDKLAIREQPGDGPLQRFLAQMAQQTGLWIVGGSIPIATGDPDRVYNTTFAYSPGGDAVARYDKIHLFRFDNGRDQFDEARVLDAGVLPVWFDAVARDGAPWRFGLSICYDLRFPELYRAYAQVGADVLLVPSAFTKTTGQAHWDVLLRARAIENLAYVLASGQGGRHDNGRDTWGHSMLVDPWGHIVDVLPVGAGLVTGVLDRARIGQLRRQLPALGHRVL